VVIDTKATREALLPTVQRAAFLAGRVTASRRMNPGLLICGAQRCGTTSMYQALRQHPAVLRPVGRKGVHYFDDVAYLKGPLWYRAHFPLVASGRRLARRSGEPALAFESSPYYLFHPAGARRIAQSLADVRVLILVRDPVERAYSAYTHERARGYEDQPFERALELEADRLAGEEERLLADDSYVSRAHRHQAYVARGHYIVQIERMIGELGRERVHVVDADDFFADPRPVWDEVRQFAGLSAAEPVFEQHNARPRSSMPPALSAQLREQFVESDEKLAQWWGRTPSWRR
jgi:hypothetical protein